ncbi:MAG: ABC transporter ATP-binding protein [Desulfobacteraceae bacterium]|nr:ABC transporter ATP-binding protein [Desulfobacteraceae bacterium]
MSYEALSMESFMESDYSLSIRNVGKMFHLYSSSKDRLKQQIFRHKKFYDEFWALQNISFNMERGESRGILGHNGAGKSTLFRILAGTMKPTAGDILLRGRVGAIMTMGSGFRQDFTGRENVYVLSALMNISRDQVDDQMDTIREFADIGIFFDSPIRTYSTGMVARLAFAVYTTLSPDILIVDEAINVGDADFQKKCHGHVSDLLNKGMTFLLVSHSPAIVRQFCKKATVLEKGKVIYDGDVEPALELYNRTRP